MDLKDKILKICEMYFNYGARLWSLGTNVYGSISLFINNLKSCSISSKLDLLNVLKIEHIGPRPVKYKSLTTLTDRFQLTVNNKNITPIHTNKQKFAAKGTIRQYLQELITINFINGSEKSTKQFKNKEFEILPDCKYFIQSNEDIDNNDIIKKFVNLITDRGFNKDSLKFEKNLGYSLFLSLLYFCEETRQIISEISVKYLEPITSRSKLLTYDSLERIKHLLNDKKQYYDLCSKMWKYIGDRSNFEKIILNEMLLKDNQSNNYENQKINSHDSYAMMAGYIKKGKDQIQACRNQLKENICQDRGYINKNDSYSDFDNYPGKTINNYQPCHIFEIKMIKREFEDEIINLYKNKHVDSKDREKINGKYQCFAKDSSNGLLMTRDAHNWFDRNKFGFHFTNGQIWINKEYEKIVCEAWNLNIKQLHSLKIKDEILNDDMKEFLKKRAAFN